MCAPLTPPATHTANATAIAQPQVISSQSPAARKMVVGVAVRPDPGRAATAIATTPSPNAIRQTHPRNSARSSPYRPLMRPTVRPSPLSGVMSDIIVPLASSGQCSAATVPTDRPLVSLRRSFLPAPGASPPTGDSGPVSGLSVVGHGPAHGVTPSGRQALGDRHGRVHQAGLLDAHDDL